MKIIVIAMSFLTFATMQAQVRNYTKKSTSPTPNNYTNNRVTKSSNAIEKDTKDQYVILGGYQYSTEVGEDYSSATGRSGYAVGFGLIGNSGKAINLEIDLLYATMGAEFDGIKDDLIYAQLPILVNLNLGQKGFKLGLGPQIGILLGAKFDGEDYKDELRSYDAGAVISGSIPFSDKFGLNLRYYYGLTNIQKDSDFVLKNQSLYAGLYLKI